MKCFNHYESEAVGLCKHCSKGLCPVCAIDTSDGLACEGRCTEQVRAINKLISNNVNASKAFKFGRFILPIFFISMGLVITLSMLTESRPFNSIDLIGAIFILMGIVHLIYNFKTVKPIENKT